MVKERKRGTRDSNSDQPSPLPSSHRKQHEFFAVSGNLRVKEESGGEKVSGGTLVGLKGRLGQADVFC